MRIGSLRSWGIAAGVAVVLAAGALPLARSQVQVTSYVAMGVASSGNASTAWFHEPSAARVTACQSVTAAGGGLSGIQCVSTRLP